MELIDKVLNGKYGDIFTSESEAKIEAQYKKYCKELHPDKNHDPRATEAFAQLGQLKAQAITALGSGTWESEDTIYFQRVDKKCTLMVRYMYHYKTDVCEYYVTNEHVLYVFEAKRKKYYDNFLKQIDFGFSNNELKKRYEPLIPHRLYETMETQDKYIISLPKLPNVYPLRAVVENLWHNKVPDRHWAWITSRLMELATFCDYINCVMNSFDLDALFVSLDEHKIYLYGGWWFATKKDAPLIGVTSAMWATMPPRAKASRIGDPTTDIEAIKVMGRTYCDNPPDAIKNFFQSGSTMAYTEWQKWEQALTKAYGQRKFIKISATKEEIYNIKE